jgi:hypothetical protein
MEYHFTPVRMATIKKENKRRERKVTSDSKDIEK